MEIEIFSGHGFKVIEISGNFDRNTFALAKKQIIPIIDPSKHLVLDLKGCHSISSVGLVFLSKLIKPYKNKKAKIMLTGLSEDLQKVINLVELKNEFEFYKNNTEAIEAIRKNQ